MTATVIDGKALANHIKADLAQRIDTLKKKGIVPSLAVILVGDDPASAVYVHNKHRTFTQLGLKSEVLRFPADIRQEDLLSKIRTLNNDESLHGILVQLPLPKHIDTHTVIDTISPEKDVDGFHVSNAGALMTGKPRFIPCTPYGVMKILESQNITTKGAEAVVVGASNIVGKPMAMLLQKEGATVTLCNSKTKDLAAHTKRADILVVATGCPEMVTGDMIKPGAVVIDVGISRGKDGKLKGDVEYISASAVAGTITPVPGGVGPMTIVMLLVNTIESAERRCHE